MLICLRVGEHEDTLGVRLLGDSVCELLRFASARNGDDDFIHFRGFLRSGR